LTQGIENYQQGQQRLDPYSQGGGQAFNAMLTAQGLNGRDAQQEYFDNYMSSPAIDSSMRAVNRAMAAKGLSNSGAANLAAARVWQDDFNTNQNRMMQLGNQGQQAATGQATFDQGIGDMRFGTGQLKANQATNYGNAMAASRNIGINNMMQLGGMALKATGWGGFGAPTTG
jgi:hypothetical protein